MLETFKFIFSSFWIFLGTFLLVSLIVDAGITSYALSTECSNKPSNFKIEVPL